MSEKHSIHCPARDIPVRAEADVLVVGGGPAGIMAAEAAAGDGLRVMLVESRGFLGGNLTIGLPVLGFLGHKGTQIIKGLPQNFIDRLRARGAASEHRPCKNHMSLTIIDEEEAKRTALEIMEEKGVEVLLYVFCTDVVKEGDDVKGVIIESKAGREAILARTVIDCTGDGDVAFRAGVECRKGDAEGGMQPPTLMFCMKGVDVQRLRDAIVQHPDVYDMDTMPAEQFRTGKFITVGLRNQIEQARAKGIHIPVARTILITGLADDEIWVNMTRVNGVDSTRPESYTHGEIEGRKQVYEVERYLREFVPGFAGAHLEKIAPFMGIRESRVIVGRYVLTAEDIIACRRFGDAIAVAGYPVDIHHAKGGDCTLYWCDDCYDIPYRTLIPAHVGNLLVAGRCSSMNHEAMASTRVMSTCMALGEAAGRAARLALKAGVQPADLDVEALRAELRFAKDETVYRMPFDKQSLGSKYPVVTLSAAIGIPGLLPGASEYYRFEGGIRYRPELPPIGYSTITVRGGHIVGTVPYPLLKLHEGNGTYFYDPYAFSCMDYYEFASDSWVAWFYEHHFNGLLLGRLPLIKKLRWREVLVFKGVWGTLSHRNDGSRPGSGAPLLFPAGMSSVSTPYLEAGFGVENIFRLLRIDCIWRLTHREPVAGEEVQRFAVNLGVQLKF